MFWSEPAANYEEFTNEVANFLNDSHLESVVAVTKKRIEPRLDDLAKAMSFYYSYPDLFIDLLVPVDSKFQLFFFQRLILRSYNRYQQTFVTATRAASKSFLAFLSRYLTCMFVPRHLASVVTDVKEQAASIAQEKIQGDLWLKFPLLANEMVKYRMPGGGVRSAVTSGKGYASYRFSSGSEFDVVGIDTARGKRRHSIIFEEVIKLDAEPITESIIPLMNVKRTIKGVINPNEKANGQQIFVTSAGFQGTFAYDKMVETMINSVLHQNDYICITIDFRVPMYHNLIARSTIEQNKASPTFNKDGFDREYYSHWSGIVKGAAFDYNTIKRARKIKDPDYKYKAKTSEENYGYGEEFYIISADMAKDGAASTAVTVLKVRPLKSWYSYLVVNGFEIETSDYEKVARILKETAIHYQAKLLVYDATGIGAAIRDWLNKPSAATNMIEELPGFGIINPPKDSEKDIIKYPHSEYNICYELKLTGTLVNDVNQYFFARLKSGMIKMLVPFREAIERKLKNKNFVYARKDKQQKAMIPYQITDRLEEELLNLDVKEITDGSTSYLRVTRRNTKIQKDFFSSLEYAVYAAHIHFERPYYKKRVRRSQKRDLSAYFRVTEVN